METSVEGDSANIDAQMNESKRRLSLLRESLSRGGLPNESRLSSLDRRQTAANRKEMIQTLLLAREGMTRELQKLMTALLALDAATPEQERLSPEREALDASIWARFRDVGRIADSKVLMKAITTKTIPDVSQIFHTLLERRRRAERCLEEEVARLRVAVEAALKTEREASEGRLASQRQQAEAEAADLCERLRRAEERARDAERALVDAEKRASEAEQALGAAEAARSDRDATVASLERKVRRLRQSKHALAERMESFAARVGSVLQQSHEELDRMPPARE